MEVATTPPVSLLVTGERTMAGTDFETFYRAKADPLRRALAVTLGDPHVAGEAIDEAMTRALARWGHVGQLADPAGWVYRVGLNWSISRWRRLRRERPLDGVEPLLGGPDPEAATVATSLLTLPIEQRAVIVCRTILEFSTAETAVALGVREGTVKSRLARGLAVLRSSLAEKEEA